VIRRIVPIALVIAFVAGVVLLAIALIGRRVELRDRLVLDRPRPYIHRSTFLRRVVNPIMLVAHLFGEVMGRVLGRFGFGGSHPSFTSDVMIEAEAEVAFDGRAILPEIAVPVLLIGGSEDILLPRAIVEETARLIPDCTLRMYEGKGHGDTMFDPRFCADVLDFLEYRLDATATDPNGGRSTWTPRLACGSSAVGPPQPRGTPTV
jgi:pimeloyl-ACP methyl ester carboxylesterase